MKRLPCGLVKIILVSLILIYSADFTPGLIAADLASQLTPLLQAPSLKGATVGITAISLTNGGKEVFSYNPNSLLIPASCQKIITSAAALVKLGVNYTFKTAIYTDSALTAGGEVKGNLYIKGFGDPFLVSEEMWKLTAHLYGKGIRVVTGDIIADDSFFDQQRLAPEWPTEAPPFWYNAKIGALSFNFNTIAVNVEPSRKVGAPLQVWLDPKNSFIKLVNRSYTCRGRGKVPLQVDKIIKNEQLTIKVAGSLPQRASHRVVYRTLNNPPQYAANVFKEFLAQQGVVVKGKVRLGEVPTGTRVLYTHKSKPLALIINGLNKWSNNFTAEQLLKTLGAELKGPPGTFEKGLSVLREFLAEIGVPPQSFRVLDGSGLSDANRVSTATLVKVLTFMYRYFPSAPEYIASLSIPNLAGTSTKRLKHLDTPGMVRVKTGRLKKVSSLAGYLATTHDEIIAFAIIMNNFNTSHEAVNKIQDKICMRLLQQ